MRPKTHEPRWPDGPVIGLGIASDAICLTYGDGTGSVKTESYGGLHGRLDAAALRDRLTQLQPSAAMLFFRMGADADFEAGVLLGTAIGMLSAMGIRSSFRPCRRPCRRRLTRFCTDAGSFISISFL